MNFNETLLRAKNFGAGLIAIGLQPHQLVGIYSQNRPEWILYEHGCYCYSLVVVPLYDTLGPDACAFIIKQTNMSTVIVEDDKKANLLLDKAPQGLKRLITIKAVRAATVQRSRNRGVEIHSFADVSDFFSAISAALIMTVFALLPLFQVEALGAKREVPDVPPTPQDICTICYTSGTTGNPKGVTLTHQNVVAGVVSVILQLGII